MPTKSENWAMFALSPSLGIGPGARGRATGSVDRSAGGIQAERFGFGSGIAHMESHGIHASIQVTAPGTPALFRISSGDRGTVSAVGGLRLC